jgi:hypothetical protein
MILPLVWVYFCLRLEKVEHWQHWAGNWGLSLDCYLKYQLENKQSSNQIIDTIYNDRQRKKQAYHLNLAAYNKNNFGTDVTLRSQACSNQLTSHT